MNAHTLIIGNLLLLLLYAAVCSIYRTSYRDLQPGLRGCDWFIASHLLLAAALLLMLSPAHLPSSLAHFNAGNVGLMFGSAVLLAHLLLHRAFAELLERPQELWGIQLCFLTVGIAIAVVQRYVPALIDSSTLNGLVWAGQCATTGIMLLRLPDPGHVATRFAAATLIVYALCHLLWFDTAPSGAGLQSVAGGRFLPALILLIQAGIAFGFLLVACSRLTIRLELEAHIDELTGLRNRRALRIAAARAIAHCRRTEGHLSVLMIDLDGMKDANDRLGHGAGDALLCAVASALRDLKRDTDYLARIGGDEFCLLLPGASEAEAISLANQCRARIRELDIVYFGEKIQARASFGVASAPTEMTNWEEMLRVSDLALYRAKAEGGNRVAVGSTPASELRSWKSSAAWPAAGASGATWDSSTTT